MDGTTLTQPGKTPFRLTGMLAFTVVSMGQFFSLLGTTATSMALGIWAFQSTGLATTVALIGFFSFGAMMGFSPVAGALIDRWNRKLVMMLSDIGAGVTTIVVLILYVTGHLEVWHLYVTSAVAGLFQAFQFPAFSAAITLMVPKEQYVRASGMISLAQSGAGVLAPVFAGAMIGVIGIGGIMAVDLVSLALALAALLLVHVPQPEESEQGRASRKGLWSETGYGFRYIFERPGLLGLQMVFLFGNLLMGAGMAIANPMVLARTGNNALIVGSVQSAAAAGGVIGGALLTMWGGPKKKMNGVALGWVGCFLLGLTFFGVARTMLAWIVAAFCCNVFIPICNGSNQAIWQRKVPPDVQGKVFAVRLMMAQISVPIAMLIVGPLADRVLEPGMRAGGGLAPIFGGLVGTGPGTGMALIFVFAGLVGAIMVLGTYISRSVRDVEFIIPDYDAVGPGTAGSTPAGVQVGNPAGEVLSTGAEQPEIAAAKEGAASKNGNDEGNG